MNDLVRENKLSGGWGNLFVVVDEELAVLELAGLEGIRDRTHGADTHSCHSLWFLGCYRRYPRIEERSGMAAGGGGRQNQKFSKISDFHISKFWINLLENLYNEKKYIFE